MYYGGPFGGAPPIFTIFFLFIFGMIVFTFIKGAMSYKENSKAPILTERVKAVSRRTNVRRHSSGNNHNSTSTIYYITFETELGQRMEIKVTGEQYGLIAEGDIGNLTYQGEWFKKFDREIGDSFNSPNDGFQNQREEFNNGIGYSENTIDNQYTDRENSRGDTIREEREANNDRVDF